LPVDHHIARTQPNDAGTDRGIGAMGDSFRRAIGGDLDLFIGIPPSVVAESLAGAAIAGQ
jgi:hypothetical protein